LNYGFQVFIPNTLQFTFASPRMNLSLLQTLDHSHTIYVPELNETYHSRNGAIQEALHVYIQMGLMEAAQKKYSIQILEIGFGTGLNAWLTLLEAQRKNLHINYHTIEPFPLPETIINNLNYTKNASAEASAIFRQMHLSDWEQAVQITTEFSLLKIQNTLEDFIPSTKYDLIYFDAFGPEKQPVLWQPDVLTKLYLCLNNGGIWVTYASKGEVKRNLKQIGFDVQRLPGPPMKRHMLRAIKPHA
jgi:tRNA U34 5-methylaminomethyl-2-thiouridine-forming methyltransferase MnmC